MSERDGVYTIGVVAKLTGMHEQTIRQYEKLGLISPQRSMGNTRMFPAYDVEQLKAIHTLTREMGVNLAGVEIILNMRQRQSQLMSLAREMFKHLDAAARARFETHLRGDEPGLVRVMRGGLAQVKKQADGQKRKIEVHGDEPEKDQA